jgi:hypothetical protein
VVAVWERLSDAFFRSRVANLRIGQRIRALEPETIRREGIEQQGAARVAASYLGAARLRQRSRGR